MKSRIYKALGLGVSTLALTMGLAGNASAYAQPDGYYWCTYKLDYYGDYQGYYITASTTSCIYDIYLSGDVRGRLVREFWYIPQ